MKCTAVVACEKIIIDKEGAHSIINVMLNAQIFLQKTEPGKAPEGVPLPSNAIAPIVWWVYTVWNPSIEDAGKTFEQVYQAYWPNGDKFMESRLPFTLKDDAPMQTTFHIGGFPAGQEGKVQVLTWLDSEGSRVSDIYDTFVRVQHRTTVPEGVPPSFVSSL
jgi:hypothetical protein